MTHWLSRNHFMRTFKPPQERLDFLQEHMPSRFAGSWPFCHMSVVVDDGWYKKGTGPLDPLTVPLVRALVQMEGVLSLSSCQGTLKQTPQFYIIATPAGIRNVKSLTEDWIPPGGELDLPNKLSLTMPLISLVGFTKDSPEKRKRHGGIALQDDAMIWQVLFFDAIALMNFNSERLGVTIEQQCGLEYVKPDWGDEWPDQVGAPVDPAAIRNILQMVPGD